MDWEVPLAGDLEALVNLNFLEALVGVAEPAVKEAPFALLPVEVDGASPPSLDWDGMASVPGSPHDATDTELRMLALFTEDELLAPKAEWSRLVQARGVLSGDELDALRRLRRRRLSCVYAGRTRQRKQAEHNNRLLALEQENALLRAEVLRLRSRLQAC